MSVRSELAREVIDELREMRNRPSYQPTRDVDLVWVVSQPGTVSKLSKDGVYNGISNDLKVVEAGITLVVGITALRLSMNPGSITRSHIEESGPIFYYNGEDSLTLGYKYPQNEDLEEMVSNPDFLIPRSRIVIDHIDRISTPPQVIGFANFLSNNHGIKKVAVVSMAPHSVRVSRYLQHYRNLFPEGVVLENASVPETVIPVGGTLREVKKIVGYFNLGHLAREPYF